MSVDRPESYLTNLDFEIRINRGGMTVSGRDLSAGRSGRDGERVFVDLVGRASGAATAELVNARGRQADNEPDLVGEIVAGPTEPQAQVLPVKDPLSPQHDPVLLAAKEITKPAAPLFVADIAPVVIGKEPAQRGFDLPPQHIIDAKTITVTETPIGPDGLPLEPVERKMIEVSPGIVLPTPEDVEKQGEALRGAVKSFILPRREIERACNDSVNQLFEMYTGVLSRFVGMIESGDENFETGSTQNLVRYYIDLMRNEYRFLDEACRDYLPVPVMDQVGQIGNIMNDVESLLPIIDDPNMMRAVENVLRGFGSNVSHLVQAALERGLEGIEFVASVIGAIAAFVYGLNPSLRPH